MKTKATSTAGFSRIDLVAVIAMATVAVMLTSAALGKTAQDANGESCISNKSQMMRALHLYATDYDDFLPPNVDDGSSFNWVYNTLSTSVTSTEATNFSKLINPATSKLAPYLKGNASPFRCPSDNSTVTIHGVPTPRVRSISMNLAVGTNPSVSGGKSPTEGAWLDGTHGHSANRTWRCYARVSDVVHPAPAGLFVFLDEHPSSINDGLFSFMGPKTSGSYSWIDWPAHYHNGAGGFAFMDGHAEIHIWQDAATLVDPSPSPNAQHDMAWIAARTSAWITEQP